jgi:hypothetical protein
MNKADVNRLCQKPGPEGMAWRLIRGWDPAGKMLVWLQAERAKGMTPEVAVSIVAEAMAATAMALATEMPPNERRDVLLGGRGLVAQMVMSLNQKLSQVGGMHNIVAVKEMPNLPPIRSNGHG